MPKAAVYKHPEESDQMCIGHNSDLGLWMQPDGLA